MTIPSQPLPTLGQNNSTEDAKIRNVLAELQGILAGGVDASNLAALAVTTAKLADANVTRAKLASDAFNSFPQLAVPAARKIAFGSALASTNVAANIVGGTIAHGLGATPVFTMAQIVPGGSFGPVNAVCTGVQTFDATNCTYYFQGINSAVVTGGSCNFFWVAIG